MTLPHFPFYVTLVFFLVTATVLLFFHIAVKKTIGYGKWANMISMLMVGWLALQYYLADTGFYIKDLRAFPPRILWTLIPTTLLIIFLFLNKAGKKFIDALPLYNMTYLSSIRVPVEIVLYWLFIYKAIPELMTFSGRNFDILAGITAPFVAYFGIKKKKMNKTALLAWNFIALGLLLFIVVNAALSTPTVIQQFALEQPNIAIFYFPMIWLPSFIVPVVLFCHFASIRQLLLGKEM